MRQLQRLGCGKETKIIPFSSETKQGREEVYAILDSVIEEGI